MNADGKYYDSEYEHDCVGVAADGGNYDARGDDNHDTANASYYKDGDADGGDNCAGYDTGASDCDCEYAGMPMVFARSDD